MAQLNLFNGGLSTRLLPHLIGITESLKCTNVDVSKGALVPTLEDVGTGLGIKKYFYFFNNTWVSFNSKTEFVEFQSKLYYTTANSIPQKSSDGLTWYNLGILKPAVKPSISINGTGDLEGTYTYCYTYYNILDGTESQPSVYSNEIVTTNQAVDVIVKASNDPQVSNINVYRLGGDLTKMSLVVQLTNTDQTYTDSLADVDIPADILVSDLYGQAPNNLRYLTEANAMLFGAIGDKLYFSEVAYINAWSPYNFIDFDDTITGIGATQNGIIVCTKYKTYIITGTSPNTLSKYLISGNQGCIEYRSMQYTNNTLIWCSTDGICVSSGGVIQVISRDKLSKLDIIPTEGIVYDDVYYLAHSKGILIVDLRFGVIFRELSTIVSGMHIANDILYYSSNDKLYTLGTSTLPKSLHYISPKFSDGAISTLKNYKTVYCNNTGNIVIKVYLDDNLVLTQSLLGGVEELKLPQETKLAYTIQFEVTGTGSIYELEYKVEGRQNGR